MSDISDDPCPSFSSSDSTDEEDMENQPGKNDFNLFITATLINHSWYLVRPLYSNSRSMCERQLLQCPCVRVNYPNVKV